MTLLCKIFGHKYIVKTKESVDEDYSSEYRKITWLYTKFDYCVRCGEDNPLIIKPKV